MQWCPKSAKEWWVDFPLSTFWVLQITLPLSKSLLCIALVACWCVPYGNRHRIACLLPPPTTLHYYFVLILRVAATGDLDNDGRLVERGIYTDYVIVSKETSLGIADLVLRTTRSTKRLSWTHSNHIPIMHMGITGMAHGMLDALTSQTTWLVLTNHCI